MKRARRHAWRRGQPSRRQRAGSVVPLTTCDRHTGGTGLASTDGVVSDRSISQPVELGNLDAGSRDSEWRTPREGSGEGRLNASAKREPPAATDSGAILSSYLRDNGPSQSQGRKP